MVTRSNACGRDNHTLATELQGAALLPGARSAAIAMRAFADAGSDGWRRCRQPTPAGIRGRTKCWARAGGGCSRSARDPTADLADGLRRNHVPPAHSPWWSPLRDSRSRCRVERRVQVERHARASVMSVGRASEGFLNGGVGSLLPTPTGASYRLHDSERRTKHGTPGASPRH